MKHRYRLPVGIAVVTSVGLTSCGGSSDSASGNADELADAAVEETVTVTSPAFGEGEPIPDEFSCDGKKISPPLAWDGVPEDAKQLALVFDDPDAGGGTYVHWVVVGMAPSHTEVGEDQLPDDARQAENSYGEAVYMAPCPPEEDDPHNYRFTVYALDEELDLEDGASAPDALDAIGRAAIAKGTLSATFDR